MALWQSAKQIENSLKEKNKELEKQIKEQKIALKRIADVYDNVDDLAGVIARETLDKFK